MVQAQGLRQRDPYQVLQIDPRAPRELIAEVFWCLVRRSRRAADWSTESAVSVTEMSTAYATLMNDPRRRALDESLGIDRRPASVQNSVEHYETLCVDPDADAQIIELAHGLLSRDEHRKRRSVRQFVLDDAHRTLSNPQLRAQYDASRTQRSERTTPAVVELTQSSPRALTSTRARGGLFGIGKRVASIPRGDLRLMALAESAMQWAVVQSDAPAVHDEFGLGPAEIVIMSGPHAGRRLALGERPVSLGGSLRDDVLLDRDQPAEALLIWHQCGRTMMKLAMGAPVTVGGAVPALSIIVLEDCDEIAIGVHEMRYRKIPEP